MNWEIHTLGGGEYLRLIFNGIAVIMGDGDYGVLLRIGILIGLLAILVRAAYKGQVLDLQWLLFAAMGFYVAFLPTATVIVVDDLDPSQSAVVDNVPLGMAATAGFSNAVGHWLAETSETVFSLPDEMRYMKQGMLFGNKLVEATMRFELSDPRVAGNMSSFWEQCVFYDLLLGQYTITDLQTAPDLWAFVQSQTSVSRAFSYQPASGPSTIEVCRTAANGVLNDELTSQIPDIENLYGAQLVRAADRNAAVAQFVSAMPIAYQYFSGLSDSASRIIMQATLSNSMQRGISAWASRVDAPAAAQDYALARAEAERRTTYTVLGQLAQKMLPIVHTLIQAGIYAVFPLVFILMLMPGGYRAVLTYMKVLFWITLWPFLFAVIHLAMSLFTSLAAEPAITLADGTKVLSMANYTAFGQVMSDYSVFAGYLSVSIPVMAWLVVSGSSIALATAAQSILASYERTASAATTEATTGNVSLGNTSFGNANWWAQNTAPSSQGGYAQQTGADGITRRVAAGREFATMPQSSLPVSMSLESAVRGSIEKGAEQATRAARSDSVAQSQRVASQLSELDQLNRQLSRSQEFRDSVDRTEAADFQQHYGDTTRMLDTLREGTRFSRSETAQLLFDGGASLSGALGIGTPGGSPVKGAIGVNARGGASYQSADAAGRQKILDQAHDLGYDTSFGTALSDTLRAGASVTGSYSGGDLESYASSAANRLSREVSAIETAQASLEHARSFNEARRLSDSEGFGTSMQLDDKFKNWLADRLGNQNQALELIREGAQGNDPTAQVELSAHMREFSAQYAEQIARTTGPLQADLVARQAAGWSSDVRSAADTTVNRQSEHDRKHIEQAAGAASLDTSSVHRDIENARVVGQRTHGELSDDMADSVAEQDARALESRQHIERDIDDSRRKSLTRQAVLEDFPDEHDATSDKRGK
ncbi:MAG: conjugal transfer protein TraG N-terminal domain-containing protein [Pseudomonadota bacterium]|nr:conjugal transfer protein TraG N-terminal domain-containing protein [Nevskiales bacterium]MEC9364764.1 conjugal transfer protein TraG N-terminal domain-containing protein [Pseudomonadota bacterium]